MADFLWISNGDFLHYQGKADNQPVVKKISIRYPKKVCHGIQLWAVKLVLKVNHCRQAAGKVYLRGRVLSDGGVAFQSLHVEQNLGSSVSANNLCKFLKVGLLSLCGDVQGLSATFCLENSSILLSLSLHFHGLLGALCLKSNGASLTLSLHLLKHGGLYVLVKKKFLNFNADNGDTPYGKSAGDGGYYLAGELCTSGQHVVQRAAANLSANGGQYLFTQGLVQVVNGVYGLNRVKNAPADDAVYADAYIVLRYATARMHVRYLLRKLNEDTLLICFTAPK